MSHTNDQTPAAIKSRSSPHPLLQKLAYELDAQVKSANLDKDTIEEIIRSVQQAVLNALSKKISEFRHVQNSNTSSTPGSVYSDVPSERSSRKRSKPSSGSQTSEDTVIEDAIVENASNASVHSSDSDTPKSKKQRNNSNKTPDLPPISLPTISKPERVPPLILTNKSALQEVRNLCQTNKIKLTKNTVWKPNGIQFFLDSAEDYRLLIEILKRKGISFHHFTLREDKNLKVVLRGVPEYENVEDIEAALRKEYNTINVTRLYSRRTKQPLNLVLVEVPRSERHIFEIRSLLGSSISAESLRRPSVNQCHRCQQFGHAQNCCFNAPKCVRCGQGHLTADCTKKAEDRTTKCANCDEAHPASYTKCSKWPKLRSKENTGRKNIPTKFVSEGISYASVSQSQNKQETKKKNTQNTSAEAGPQQNYNKLESMFLSLVQTVKDMQTTVNQLIMHQNATKNGQ